MSAGKVIFSFSDGFNLVLNEEEVAKGAIIKFGTGFDQFNIQYNDSALSLISQREILNRQPTVEFTPKLKVEHSDLMQVEQTAAVTTAVAEVPLVLPLQFHEGTVGSMTKTQKRNLNRRFKKKMDKLERQSRLPSLIVVPESFGNTPVSTLAARTPPADEEYVPQYVQEVPHHQITFNDELERVRDVRRRNFEHFQRIRGKTINILEGLELHEGVFLEEEQQKIIRAVYDARDKGRAGLLKPRTYSEPRKWMRGKGRITIQFGCCYNYAVDINGNPPGIIRHEDVDPIPPLLQRMIKRMVAWHVLPPEVTPDSCIVNIYDEGDCIPPHVDSHDFLRPFCTASFLGECNIMFGTELRIKGPGEFSGPVQIPLPVGSVLVLAGNGADLSKHCVPAVPRQRISITFRKMVPNKQPYNFVPETELQGLYPLSL